MAGAVLVSVLKAVLLLGCVLMALKLYRTGLYSRYPIFFAFFIFRIPNSIWPLFLEVSSPAYQKVWVLTEPIEFMFYVLATERGIETGLAIFILLILCFLSFFPVKLSRNVRVHAMVFSIFFLSNTFVLLMRSLFGMHLRNE